MVVVGRMGQGIRVDVLQVGKTAKRGMGRLQVVSEADGQSWMIGVWGVRGWSRVDRTVFPQK